MATEQRLRKQLDALRAQVDSASERRDARRVALDASTANLQEAQSAAERKCAAMAEVARGVVGDVKVRRCKWTSG